MNIPNIDTLCVTIDILNYGKADIDKNDSLDFINKLECHKQAAKEASKKSMTYKHIIEIGNQSFQIMPNGSPGYAYILHNDAYEVKVAQFRSRNEKFYPVYVKIKSQFLWSKGAADAWRIIKEWIAANIGEIKDSKINRIDLCCHTDELELTDADIDTFEGRYHVDTIYRFRRKMNAIYFGSGSTGKIYCRIYDKVLEIVQKKKKLWFIDLWNERGLNPNRAWNVEFEIKRGFLKEIKMDGVDETLQNLKSLWEYCTKSWIVKKVLDRTRIENCPVSPEWQSIQAAFDTFEGKGLITREKQQNASAFALIPGTIGNITSYAARTEITDINQIFDMIKTQGARYLDKRDRSYEEIIEEKRSLMN